MKPTSKKKLPNGNVSTPAKSKQNAKTPQPQSNKKTPNKKEQQQNKKPVSAAFEYIFCPS